MLHMKNCILIRALIIDNVLFGWGSFSYVGTRLGILREPPNIN